MAEPGNKTDMQAATSRLMARFRDTVCVKYAAEAEQTAREAAPWTDQTDDARKLIKGVVFFDEVVTVDTYKREGDKNVRSGTVIVDGKGAIGFALVHCVEYGKSLEWDGDGKYAVLKPTIEGLRAGFFSTAKEFFGGRI
jgi:hypothetical protein